MTILNVLIKCISLFVIGLLRVLFLRYTCRDDGVKCRCVRADELCKIQTLEHSLCGKTCRLSNMKPHKAGRGVDSATMLEYWYVLCVRVCVWERQCVCACVCACLCVKCWHEIAVAPWALPTWHCPLCSSMAQCLSLLWNWLCVCECVLFQCVSVYVCLRVPWKERYPKRTNRRM